jgi:hypothetical protein
MATAELDAIFATTLSNTKTLTLEIETTDSTGVKTLGQRSVTVRRDLVSTGNAIPSPQASYYTRAETDAGFVPNSGTNVDSTNRVLHDSGGTDSVDWQNRKLYDGSTEYIAWNDGLGFYGNTAIAQPTGTNVVSNVISLGLIASSPTYGVLPQSPRTLTAVTYTTFGLVPSNNVISKTVTITGCQLNDIVLLGLPANIEEGLAFSGHVVNANQIHIDALNVTGSGKTQTAATYRITVIGY